MKRNAVLALAVGAGLALAAGSAFAHAGPRRGAVAAGPRDEARMFARLADRLDLNEEQRGRIRGIFRDRWQGPLGEAVRAHRRAKERVAQTIHDPVADPDAIRAAVRAAADAGEALALERHAAFVEAYRVLTPEQQAEATRLRAERMERRERPRGRRAP